MDSLLEYNPDSGEFRWKENRGPTVRKGDIAGTISAHGYRIINIQGKLYRCSRLAWFFTHGEWPNIIDHINRNRLDDRIDNLRNVTQRENCGNRGSGCPGVQWKTDRNKWRVNIRHNDQLITLGQTSDYFEACCLRKSAELKYEAKLYNAKRYGG